MPVWPCLAQCLAQRRPNIWGLRSRTLDVLFPPPGATPFLEAQPLLLSQPLVCKEDNEQALAPHTPRLDPGPASTGRPQPALRATVGMFSI